MFTVLAYIREHTMHACLYFLIFIRLLSILLNKYLHRGLEGDQVDLNAWLGALTCVLISIPVVFHPGGSVHRE